MIPSLSRTVRRDPLAQGCAELLADQRREQVPPDVRVREVRAGWMDELMGEDVGQQRVEVLPAQIVAEQEALVEPHRVRQEVAQAHALQVFPAARRLSVQELGEEGPDREVEGQRLSAQTDALGDGRPHGEGHHDLADGPDVDRRRRAVGEVAKERAGRPGDEQAGHPDAGRPGRA